MEKGGLGKRIYIATQEGLYVSDKPVLKRKEKYDDWWTFSGITTVMKEGVI